MTLTNTELHAHLIQCLTVEDLFLLGKDIYRDINWDRFDFLNRYERIMGVRLDPIALFENAIRTNDLSGLREVAVYRYTPDGSFAAFDITSFFPYCITGYYYDKDEPETVLKVITDRHKAQGIRYIEYRNGFYGEGEEWRTWHARFARFLRAQATPTFTPRYIVRLGSYTETKQILQEHPDLVDTIVGVDFSGPERSPLSLRAFYQDYQEDQKKELHSLSLVVHIGEDFFDKSLSSAIRWVHQSALFGARRLAHCIALGLDPAVALARRSDGHRKETVQERLDQIAYDLEHEADLRRYGVAIDRASLVAERDRLSHQDPNTLVTIDYDEGQVMEIRLRQDYVLDELARLNVPIELCPTSNLCIGGIPSIKDHSLHKILRSKAPVVICTDDPGIFDITLRDEINLLVSLGYDLAWLEERVTDPATVTLESRFTQPRRKK